MRHLLYGSSELEIKLNTINEYISLYDVNYKTYQKRGWRLLKELINSAPLINMDNQTLNIIIGQVVKLAGIYYSQIKLHDSYFNRRRQIRKSIKSLKFFSTVLTKIETSGKHINYNVFIDIFELYSFWQHERFCINITEIYFKVTAKNQHVIDEVFTNVEENLENADQEIKIKSLMHVFITLVTIKDFWPGNNQIWITRYLGLFFKAVMVNSYLCNVMELSIKNIYSVCSSEILLFAVEHTLEHYTELDLPQAQLAKIERSVLIATRWFSSTEPLWTVFKYDTLKNIFSLIASTTEHKSSFGNQTFQAMLDSQQNKKNLIHPRIFYFKNDYEINKKPLQQYDKDFMKQYRKEIHVTLLIAFKNHHENITIIGHLYTTICLIIIEVLCDFTIAMMVCLLMNVQKYVLNDTNISANASHRIHAVIISVMSLICWLTNASMLTIYLEKVLQERAYNAPFLNPPLKDAYQYTNHYILWNKPELFFETFEVRYALWKRFRLNETSIARISQDAFKRKLKKRRTITKIHGQLHIRNDRTIWEKN